MADREAAGLVHRHAVGAGAARHLDEDANALGAAVRQQRHAPHRVAARHRQIEDLLVRREDQAVGARDVLDHDLEPAVGAQAIESPAGVAHVAFALIGEVAIAVLGEDQIVEPLEALAARPVDQRRHLAARRIEQHQALLVVGDEDAAVLVDLEPVGLAVVLGDDAELASRRHLHDLAVRDVDDVEVAGAVERWPFNRCTVTAPASEGGPR